MVLARDYYNIYSMSKPNNLKISYSRIVDCFDDNKIIKVITFNNLFGDMM